MEPLYVTSPGGMRLIRTVTVVIILGCLLLAVVMLVTVDVVAALVTAGSLALTFVFILAILPQRYEVWRDRLEIVFPLWRWRIGMESIETARPSHTLEPYAFLGYRFATAPGQAVTVLRRNAGFFTRPNLVISPADREEFLRHLHRAMR